MIQYFYEKNIQASFLAGIFVCLFSPPTCYPPVLIRAFAHLCPAPDPYR